MKSQKFRRTARRQNGAALIIALIILMLASILGISSIRSTTLQERMSANIIDRATVFQNAESILRAAELHFFNNPNLAAHNGITCDHTQPVCDTVPADNSQNWNNLPNPPTVNQHLPATGVPQYHIAFLGQAVDAGDPGLGQNLSALAVQYGGAGAGAVTSSVFRITIRTHNPNTEGEGRAFVQLQSIVRVRQ